LLTANAMSAAATTAAMIQTLDLDELVVTLDMRSSL
jgi:hypothetical protein